jgi:hypothetical protein
MTLFAGAIIFVLVLNSTDVDAVASFTISLSLVIFAAGLDPLLFFCVVEPPLISCFKV